MYTDAGILNRFAFYVNDKHARCKGLTKKMCWLHRPLELEPFRKQYMFSCISCCVGPGSRKKQIVSSQAVNLLRVVSRIILFTTKMSNESTGIKKYYDPTTQNGNIKTNILVYKSFNH